MGALASVLADLGAALEAVPGAALEAVGPAPGAQRGIAGWQGEGLPGLGRPRDQGKVKHPLQAKHQIKNHIQS